MGLGQITDLKVVIFLGGSWTSGPLLAQVHAEQPKRLHVNMVGGQALVLPGAPVASWRGGRGKGLPGASGGKPRNSRASL